MTTKGRGFSLKEQRAPPPQNPGQMSPPSSPRAHTHSAGYIQVGYILLHLSIPFPPNPFHSVILVPHTPLSSLLSCMGRSCQARESGLDLWVSGHINP